METDGPAALYELADRVAFDAELKRILIGKRLHDLADQWKTERERNIRTDWRKCPDCGMDWPHPSETSSFVCPSCRSAAARAALERAREILALNTGIDFLDACRDLRAAVDIMHNNRHALERAKALLAEIESEARKQIANPNSNASQMVVAEAIGETCRRIANTLDNTQ